MSWETLRSTLVYGELEYLSIDKETFNPTLKEVSPKVLGGYIGIGRRYPMSKKVNVTISALYRYEFSGHVPGMSPLNMRVVFELRPKRKSIAPK